MQTYYHGNPKIEEWTKQIIEQILTVCLLSGVDSDAEYQKGCQLIAKIAGLLQDFSPIPAEYLADGLKQIIEQKLPDLRLLSNFPTFQDTMDKMIKEGMLNAMADIEIVPVQLEDLKVQPALAPIYDVNDKADRLADSANQELKELAEQRSGGECSEGETNTLPQAQTHKEYFKKLLPYLFPKETIQWDVRLLGETFLAQVNDVLMYCTNSDQSLKEEAYIKDGWKIMTVREDELAYPRRLERELKNLMRKGKRVK